MSRTGCSLAVIAVVAAIMLPACGSGSERRSTTGFSRAPAGVLTIDPATATPTSQVRFSFAAPATAGIHGDTEYSFVLMVSGPRRTGCVGAHSADEPEVQTGPMLGVALGPAQLGGDWCTGRYSARVEELARAACSAGQMCPQYVRIVGVVASGGFRVASR